MIILAEKPSVATDIAKALGRFKLQNGIWISGKDCVLSARGHLLISLMPEEYDSKYRTEWYMFAEEAKKKGFIDYIVGDGDCDVDNIV